MNSLFVLLGAIPAFLLYKIVAWVATSLKNASTARRRGCKRPPELPSPDPLGILLTLEIIRENNKGKLLEYIRERFRRVSAVANRPALTFETHVLRNWLIVTKDPKNIQALLATQFKEFELGPIRFGTFSPLLGHGIFSSDGKRWEHSRTLLRPQFVRDQVSDLDLEEMHVQNLFQAIPSSNGGWTSVVDLQPLFFRLTMDSASEFLFGESCNTQLAALPGYTSPDASQHADFVTAFENSQDCIARAFRFNDWYSIGLTKEYYAYCTTCHTYIDRFVRKALAHDGEKSLEAGEKDKYIFLEALAQHTRDPVEIRDQLLSILVAGRDTTASLLSFLFLTLAQHPDKLATLRAAILADFGSADASKLSFSSLKACQYLQWCLNETLRLFPTVPLNSRRSIVDTTIPRGGGPDGMAPVFVPKGTEVNYSVYAMHRTPEFWGDDADAFRPERWEGRKPGFEYLPFNGGPRICLGQQFALTEAGYVTVRLLQKFDKLECLDGNEQGIDWFLTLTGRPKDGCKLRMHAAQES